MFPDFTTWCDTVLHPQDTHPWDFRTQSFYDEYRAKYAIAKMIKPDTIIEIGVRFGYGANSFLSAYSDDDFNRCLQYIGLDADEPSWGPYTGVPRKWAEARLRERFSTTITTHKFNTQKGDVAELELPRVDMVHIDADHSYEGALRDMETFWPFCKRVMVVDDYIEIADVKDAVETFCAAHKDVVQLPVTTFRGAMLLVRGQ